MIRDNIQKETKVGTATEADVLSGKTFTNESGVGISGSMKNNGAINKTITPSKSQQTYTIPAGFHDGSGKVVVDAIPSTYASAKSGSGSYTAWSNSSQTSLGKKNTYTINTGLNSITSYGFRTNSNISVISSSVSGGTITFTLATPNTDASVSVYWCAYGS